MAEYVRPIDALAAEMVDRLDAKNAEIARLRARLETVEAETRERCAKVGAKLLSENSPIDHRAVKWVRAYTDAIRNLEPRHD